MKRAIAVTLTMLMIFTLGCKRQHPSMINIDPEFDPGKIRTILVIPAMSSITKGDDPNRESEVMVDKVIWTFVSERGDYSFISPNSFLGTVGRAGLMDQMSEFIDSWMNHKVLKEEFKQAITMLNPDIILIPEVYLWNKDEADYRESATSSVTQVGITMSMVDPRSGMILWQATDENFKESVRTEGERVQASSGGIDRRVAGKTASGKDMYAAPPFDDVAVLVIESLVTAIPEKVVTGK